MTQHLISRLTLAFGLYLIPLAAGETPQARPEATAPQARSEQRARRMHRGMERMARHLNLTDDQKAKIKAIHEKHKDELKSRREATQQARKAFFEAVKNPDTPVDQLRTLHQTLSDKSFDMLAARRAVRLETRAILTPEQREKAAEAMGRMEERMKNRRERFQGHMGDQ